MGMLLRLNSRQFFKKFLKDNNVNDFVFIILSENITTNHKYDNVIDLKKFIPPHHIITEYLDNGGMTDTYVTKYLRYLGEDNSKMFIHAIVGSVVNHDRNIVLLCSSVEDVYKYQKMLCKYIENSYGLTSYTAKTFEGLDKIGPILTQQKEKIAKKLLKENYDTDDIMVLKERVKEKVQALLKDLELYDRKKLYKFCREKQLKVEKGMSRKELMDAFIKQYLHRYVI